MKWWVNCAANCGAEVYEADSKEAAILIAERVYDHDRVPHGNEQTWQVKQVSDDAKVSQRRDIHIDDNRRITFGPWKDIK